MQAIGQYMGFQIISLTPKEHGSFGREQDAREESRNREWTYVDERDEANLRKIAG